jgi:hypothetical protein
VVEDVEPIALGIHHADRDAVLRAEIQRAPHARYQAGQRTRVWRQVVAPDRVFDAPAGQDAAGVGKHQHGQIELLGRHRNPFAVEHRIAARVVQFVRTGTQRHGGVQARAVHAPAQRGDARQQDACAERAYHVVICTRVQRFDHVVIVGVAGEYHDRHVAVAYGTYGANDIDGGDIGQLAIDQEHVMAVMTQTVDQVAPGPEGVALVTRNREKFLQGVKR